MYLYSFRVPSNKYVNHMPLQRDWDREKLQSISLLRKKASICRLQLAQGRGEVGSKAKVKSQVIWLLHWHCGVWWAVVLGQLFENAWKYLAYSSWHLYVESNQPSICCSSPHRTSSPTSCWHTTVSQNFIMFSYISKILLCWGVVILKNYFPST